jgi:hypothetical protein
MSRVPHLVWHIITLPIVSNSINEYHDFGTIAGATLAMAATSMNRKVDEDEIKEALRPLNITGIPK